VYYQCPHNPANPRHAAAAPDHPRTVKAPETRLDQIVALFFTDHVFGPRRAELLAAQLPATDAAAVAGRDASAAAIKTRLKQIDTAQNSCILELEQLPADPADTAAAALRGRIRARFTDLHAEREQLDTQLAALVLPGAQDADEGVTDGADVKGPAGVSRAGPFIVWVSPLSARCRCGHSSRSSLTAVRVAVSSTIAFFAANVATSDCRARLLTARG
jgi:hypothetical protein